MSDLGVRTAARKKAEREIKAIRQEVGFSDEGSPWWDTGFSDGAAWAAGRLPTRDEIAAEVARFWADTDTPEDAADAVLALIQDRMTT